MFYQTLLRRGSVSTGCPKKHVISKNTSLILEFICAIHSSTQILNLYDSWKILLVLGFPECGRVFCVLSILPIKNFVQISISLNKTQMVEIGTKPLRYRWVGKNKKGWPHFGNVMNCDLYLYNFTSRKRLTNKCGKLYLKSKTAFKSFCYCHAS